MVFDQEKNVGLEVLIIVNNLVKFGTSSQNGF